tara:strand:- start:303 stop:476 length:174 start_codon:yes stop_codon:yes gene_type:complete
MNKKPTGGPVEEMTLRDYFAAKAMEGQMANEEYNSCSYTDISDMAYAVADAMLEARK